MLKITKLIIEGKLIHIDLSNCDLENEDMIELGILLKDNPTVISVNLESNNITDTKIISEMFNCVQKLNLSYNNIGMTGAMNCRKMSGLKELDLRFTGLSNDVMKLFTPHIKMNINENPRIDLETKYMFNQPSVDFETYKKMVELKCELNKTVHLHIPIH